MPGRFQNSDSATRILWDAGDFYIKSVAGGRKLGKRAVLLGGDGPLNQPPGLAPNDVNAADYAPHSRIFPRAGD